LEVGEDGHGRVAAVKDKYNQEEIKLFKVQGILPGKIIGEVIPTAFG